MRMIHTILPNFQVPPRFTALHQGWHKEFKISINNARVFPLKLALKF
jgi:hypothetical protein